MYKLNIDSKIARLFVKLSYEIAVKRVAKMITIENKEKNAELEVQEDNVPEHLVENKMK